MSDLSNTSFPLPLRQTVLHDRVEQLALALGAARERTVRDLTISASEQDDLNNAINAWDNEGGSTSDALATRGLSTQQRAGRFRFRADLFRDDTLGRAIIWNGLILTIAATVIAIAYSW